MSHKLDAKSDLYIYFYLHGLSLLNPRGAFCFITSNSWLDVGYGADLQEFLLKHCHVKLILDNQLKRSFAQADVNTVIALFSPPEESREWGLAETARFVMFKTPYEHVVSPVIFEEIDQADDRKATQEYRVSPVNQKTLLEEGSEGPEEEEDSAKKLQKGALRPLIEVSRYIGNKWGGKYLRAPEIYWSILAKARDRLVAIEPYIGEVVTVSWSRQGRNKEILISKDRIKEGKTIPVLKSPREFDGIVIRQKDTKTYLRTDLVENNQIVRTPLVWDDIRGERHICRLNQDLLAFTHNFHGIAIKNEDWIWKVCACLNSTLTWLFIETLGRRGLGGGAVRILVKDLKKAPILLHPDNFTREQLQVLETAFKDLVARPVQTVTTEVRKDDQGCIVKQDRRALDDVIFDVIGLTETERDEVYEAVINLVEGRLKKAESLSSKTLRKRVEAAEKTRGIWAELPGEATDEEE